MYEYDTGSIQLLAEMQLPIKFIPLANDLSHKKYHFNSQSNYRAVFNQHYTTVERFHNAKNSFLRL